MSTPDDHSSQMHGLETIPGLSLPAFAIPSAAYARDMQTRLEEIGRAADEAREAPTARRAVQRIRGEIRAFEAQLDDTTEVGLKLVAFGQVSVVHIDEISYHQPNLVVFVGRNEQGSPVRLVQHISQLSFILCREPRQRPDKPRRPVGFVIPDDATDRAD